MNKKILYLNAVVLTLLVVCALFLNAQAADKNYVYGSKAEGETSVQILNKSVRQQEEIIQILKQIRGDSERQEIIALLKEIKGLLAQSVKAKDL